MATYSGTVGVDEYTPSNTFTPAPQKNGSNFYGNWINSNYKWRLTSVDNTNKIAHWDMVDGTTVYQQYGFQIHWDATNSKNVVRANDGSNTSDPHEFSVGQAQSSSDRHINIDTTDGDRLFGYGSSNANDDFDITWLFGTNGIPLWSSGGSSSSWPSAIVLNTPLYYTGPWDLHSSSTATVKKYGIATTHGIEFHDVNNTTVLKCNETALGGQTSPPTVFSITRGGSVLSTGNTSAVVQDGDTIDCYDGSTWIMGFDIDMSGTNQLIFPTSSGGGGGGFLSTEDPRFTNVSFTKTEDDHVTLTFDFDEMDGTLTNYVVHKKTADGTETNSADQGISGSSGTITRTGAHIPILDGLAEGDQLWIEHSSNPIHIVWDNDGYGGIDNPYVHSKVNWSIENVNGQKSVVARFFGVDTGYPFDHYSFAVGPRVNTQTSVVWDGTLKTVTSPYRPSTMYYIALNAGNTSPLYGARYYTKGGKVFSNFW